VKIVVVWFGGYVNIDWRETRSEIWLWLDIEKLVRIFSGLRFKNESAISVRSLLNHFSTRKSEQRLKKTTTFEEVFKLILT
jgi:mannitol/fructose-specific phosphotransferase system IIA component